MHSMLDNGKHFHDLHTPLEKWYLEPCSVIKLEAAMKFSSACAVLAGVTGWPANYLPKVSMCAFTSMTFCKFLG